jgi:hypothetical protein
MFGWYPGWAFASLNILKVPMRNAAKRTPAKNGSETFIILDMTALLIEMEFIETIKHAISCCKSNLKP